MESGTEGDVPEDAETSDTHEVSRPEPAGGSEEGFMQSAREPFWRAMSLNDRLREARVRRDLLMAGGVLVLIGSILMLLSPFVALVVARAVIEGETGQTVDWVHMIFEVLISGAGLIVCFGTIVMVALSLYGIHMGVTMIRGVIPSPLEAGFTIIVVGEVGSMISLFVTGGIIGFVGAILVLIGGLIPIEQV